MKLNEINVFENIDLSMCKNNLEKIELILKTNTFAFKNLFNLLDEEEKEKYFKYLNPYKIKEYLSTKDDKFIFNYIICEYQNLDKFAFNYIVRLIENENLKYEIIMNLINNNSKESHNYISYAINIINNDVNKIKLIKKMIKKNINIKIITDSIISLKSDENKILFLSDVLNHKQIDIIKSFKNINLIKEYSLEYKYRKYRFELIVATKDPEFIKEQFMKMKTMEEKNNLLNFIENKKIKLQLIKSINDLTVQYFHLTNYNFFSKKLLNEIKIDDIKKDNIDENITIGIELECCHKNIEQYQNIPYILKYFDIVEEPTLKNGFEIISPILHYNVNDLHQLKTICTILNNCGFYTDHNCGGHIHIGADYLNKKEEMFILLYIYTNCEHIIYKICNKEYNKERKCINTQAKMTKDIYLKAAKEELLNEKLSFQEMIVLLKNINNNRETGLNLQNLDKKSKHTIEFRMPNGEINFDELLSNIKLFTKLVQVSHNLAMMDSSSEKRKLLSLLSNQIKEKDRLEILLNILFDKEEERDIYRKRYNHNTNIFDFITNELNYKKEELIEINEDNKNLTLKKANI